MTLPTLLCVCLVLIAMCRLGCDRLFEQGYLAFDEGRIVACRRERLTPDLREHVRSLEGRVCRHWSEASRGYFAWRLERARL